MTFFFREAVGEAMSLDGFIEQEGEDGSSEEL